MRPKTLRRRKWLFRKHSRWKPLALISVGLALFVFVDARLWVMDLADRPAHTPAGGAVMQAAAQRQREAPRAASPAQERAASLQSGPDQAVPTTAPVATAPEPTQPPPAELGSPAQTTPVSTAPASTEAASTEAASTDAAPSTPPAMLTAREACDSIRARTWRVGEQVSFRGEYISDHSGLTMIRPVGCDRGAGVAVIEPSAVRRIDEADPRPWSFPGRRLIAQFTATLVQGGQDESDFDHDNGVRLSISSIRYVKVVQPASAQSPPAQSPPAPATRTPTPGEDCSPCSDDVVDSLIRRHR
jgi:hypothetical protein